MRWARNRRMTYNVNEHLLTKASNNAYTQRSNSYSSALDSSDRRMVMCIPCYSNRMISYDKIGKTRILPHILFI